MAVAYSYSDTLTRIRTPLCWTSLVEYLVVTDRAASDDSDLYPVEEPSVGRSTVSVPLQAPPPGGVAATLVTVLIPGEESVSPVEHALLWDGVLELPTGNLVLSDWSMQPKHTATLTPGSYDVSIRQSSDGHLYLHLRLQ